jgi:hypothetical protein
MSLCRKSIECSDLQRETTTKLTLGSVSEPVRLSRQVTFEGIDNYYDYASRHPVAIRRHHTP